MWALRKTCRKCIKEIEGIEDVLVNLKKKGHYRIKNSVKDDKIKEVIDDAGYDVIEIKIYLCDTEM